VQATAALPASASATSGDLVIHLQQQVRGDIVNYRLNLKSERANGSAARQRQHHQRRQVLHAQ